jgi:hypothetical protein
MKKLLILPALLFVACGDNLAPTDEQATAGAEATSTDTEDDVSRPIDASIYIEMPSCTDALAKFEAGVSYVDDGSPVGTVACKWTFDDGTTSDECAGEHIFAAAGNHEFVLDVTHTVTGETAHSSQVRYVEAPHIADLVVTAPECGLEFSYTATVSTPSENHIEILEADKVLDLDPYAVEGTVHVTEPGTYTVVYTAEDERQSGPICEARVERQVTVTACHDHTPDCGH